MTGSYVNITSSSHLEDLVAKNTYVFIDFTATWCPPCRAIAPHFESFAKLHSKEGAFAFAKVDVDEQSAVAQKYGIQAMPTFILLKNGSPTQTVKGANPPAIKKLVEGVSMELYRADKAKKESEQKEEKEQKPKQDQPTVSGQYTVSSNPSWRMAL